MALLQEINYNTAEDTMQDAFDKINATIQTINAVLGAGATGEAIRKVDATDFNYEFFDPTDVTHADEADAVTDGTYVIRTKVIPIGVWNMDTTDSVYIDHDLGTDISKIVSCTASIFRDDLARSYQLNQYGGSGGGSGITYVGTVGVLLYRAVFGSTPLEIFDSADFNNSVMNRGWIVIKYVD